MTPHPTPVPLILTAALAPAHQARFDALRRRHFPPALNHIPAHLTLFHHLPGAEHPAIDALLHRLAAATSAGPAAVTGLRSLGRGVAFTLECPALAAIRAELARAFAAHLTAQDRQAWRPHVTIQNKVAPAEAATLLDHMRAAFSPFTVDVAGLDLWHYRGGPWDVAGHYPFTCQPSPLPSLEPP